MSIHHFLYDPTKQGKGLRFLKGKEDERLYSFRMDYETMQKENIGFKAIVKSSHRQSIGYCAV